MKCPNCEAQLPEGSPECPWCGAKLELKPPTPSPVPVPTLQPAAPPDRLSGQDTGYYSAEQPVNHYTGPGVESSAAVTTQHAKKKISLFVWIVAAIVLTIIACCVISFLMGLISA